MGGYACHFENWEDIAWRDDPLVTILPMTYRHTRHTKRDAELSGRASGFNCFIECGHMLLLLIDSKSKPQIYTSCKSWIYCVYKPNIYNDSMKKEEPNLVLVERLTEITDRGVTKADMARIAGVTPQAVNGWFKKGVISKRSALAIADAVGISVAWLLGEDVDEKDGLKPDEKRLLELYRQLPEEEQKNMLRIVSLRLKELDELYAKYMGRRIKGDD